jgi:hypothetical protein
MRRPRGMGSSVVTPAAWMAEERMRRRGVAGATARGMGWSIARRFAVREGIPQELKPLFFIREQRPEPEGSGYLEARKGVRKSLQNAVID